MATNRSDPEEGTSVRDPPGLVSALLFQWVNPKAWAVAVSLLTLYSDPDAGLFSMHMLVLLLVATFASVVSTHAAADADIQHNNGGAAAVLSGDFHRLASGLRHAGRSDNAAGALLCAAVLLFARGEQGDYSEALRVSAQGVPEHTVPVGRENACRQSVRHLTGHALPIPFLPQKRSPLF